MDAFLQTVVRLLVFLVGVVSFRPRFTTMSMPVTTDDVGLSVPYTVNELMAIVDVHNQQRGNVTPTAADMEYMYWDEELAAAADGWGVKCTLQHGKPENSTISRFGQNIWAGYSLSTWAPPDTLAPFRAWNNEDRFYDYETNSCEEGRMCGHYTQIVWASTQAIGCGRAFCSQNEDIPFDRWIVVCNYFPGGNVQGRQPYIAGPSCTRCASGNGQCYKNKCRPCSEHTESCDCNLQCQNCGKLDRDTCTCSCPKGWHGNECGKPCVDTHEYCGKSPGWPGRYFCPFASYIPRYCPLMCGVCEAEDPDFVCEENISADVLLTTDAVTTENIEDGITTGIGTPYDEITADVTNDVTTSYKDLSTTPDPMTVLDLDLVTQENFSTKTPDGTPAEQTEEGFLSVVTATTPLTTKPAWVEKLSEEILESGKPVNIATKSIETELSNQLRLQIQNFSYVALEENVEISAENGILVDRTVDSAVQEDELGATNQPEATSSVSRSSNEIDSESLTTDMDITKTEQPLGVRPTNTVSHESRMLTSYAQDTISPTVSSLQSTPTLVPSAQRTKNMESNANLSHEQTIRTSSTEIPQLPPSYIATISEDDQTEKPSSKPETRLLTSTDLSSVNSVNGSSVPYPTTSTSEVFRTTASTTITETDPHIVQNLGVTTEAPVEKDLSTLNLINADPQTTREDDDSSTGASGDLENLPVSSRKENQKKLGAISENLCRKTYTAMAAKGTTLLLFQGQRLWRVNKSSGQTLSEKETVQSYFGLDGQKVTAAFYRPSVDEWTLFTYIDVFTIRNHSQLQETSVYHRSRVTELGIPFGVVVDAAIHDERRKKSYVFTNRWVWRYDDERGELDDGFPSRTHHEFPDLMRYRPSAAVTLNGTHYILYGKKYMMIDEETHQVDERIGENFLEEYFDCFSEYQ